MKITSGNQIIGKLRDLGGYELDDLQFREAIVIVKQLRAAKVARNDRAIPEGLLSLTVLYYDGYLKSLKRAME